MKDDYTIGSIALIILFLIGLTLLFVNSQEQGKRGCELNEMKFSNIDISGNIYCFDTNYKIIDINSKWFHTQ